MRLAVKYLRGSFKCQESRDYGDKVAFNAYSYLAVFGGTFLGEFFMLAVVRLIQIRAKETICKL